MNIVCVDGLTDDQIRNRIKYSVPIRKRFVGTYKYILTTYNTKKYLILGDNTLQPIIHAIDSIRIRKYQYYIPYSKERTYYLYEFYGVYTYRYYRWLKELSNYRLYCEITLNKNEEQFLKDNKMGAYI